MSLLFRKSHEASESSEQNYDFYLYIQFGKRSNDRSAVLVLRTEHNFNEHTFS